MPERLSKPGARKPRPRGRWLVFFKSRLSIMTFGGELAEETCLLQIGQFLYIKNVRTKCQNGTLILLKCHELNVLDGIKDSCWIKVEGMGIKWIATALASRSQKLTKSILCIPLSDVHTRSNTPVSAARLLFSSSLVGRLFSHPPRENDDKANRKR